MMPAAWAPNKRIYVTGLCEPNRVSKRPPSQLWRPDVNAIVCSKTGCIEPCLTARSQTWEGATTMKTAYRATIGRITARFNWDRSGVFLAALLFLGECVAVILAVISLASKGYDPGQSAALLGAAVLAVYVPLAIWQGKMPFAAPTEYEKRRTYAQAKLSVRIPRSGDKTKGGWALGVAQVHLEDSSDESIRAAVGRAYCLGDQDL